MSPVHHFPKGNHAGTSLLHFYFHWHSRIVLAVLFENAEENVMFHWPCAYRPVLRNFFEHIIYPFCVIWSASVLVHPGLYFPFNWALGTSWRPVQPWALFNKCFWKSPEWSWTYCILTRVGSRHSIYPLRLISSIRLSLVGFSSQVCCATQFDMLHRPTFFFNQLSYFIFIHILSNHPIQSGVRTAKLGTQGGRFRSNCNYVAAYGPWVYSGAISQLKQSHIPNGWPWQNRLRALTFWLGIFRKRLNMGSETLKDR